MQFGTTHLANYLWQHTQRQVSLATFDTTCKKRVACCAPKISMLGMLIVEIPCFKGSMALMTHTLAKQRANEWTVLRPLDMQRPVVSGTSTVAASTMRASLGRAEKIMVAHVRPVVVALSF